MGQWNRLYLLKKILNSKYYTLLLDNFQLAQIINVVLKRNERTTYIGSSSQDTDFEMFGYPLPWEQEEGQTSRDRKVVLCKIWFRSDTM